MSAPQELLSGAPEPAAGAEGLQGDAAHNLKLAAKPSVSTPHYIFGMPGWAVNMAQIAMGTLSVVSGYFAFALHGRLPALATVCMGIAAIALLALAVYPGIGRKKTCFICDRNGMYFPRPSGWFAGGGMGSWLFVPWGNISNVRVEPVISGESLVEGVVFSVRLLLQEERAFFSGYVLRREVRGGKRWRLSCRKRARRLRQPLPRSI